MKALYRNEMTYLVRISNDMFYYGDGVKTNAFGTTAVQFLRFNPYMKDVSEQAIEIPVGIKEKINEHLKETKK